MTNGNKTEKKTFWQKFGKGFTIFSIIFLISRFSGVLDPVAEFFKN